ncbi:MAG: ribonuclease D [Pseudomonadota bacterium]
MSWTLIQNDADLRSVVASLEPCSELAVDTEFMRRNTYNPQIGLLQLCADDEAFLIDPLAVSDLDGLKALLVAPSVVKVLHSCSEDLEVFRHWLGLLPEPLIDTQRAAALLGEPFGLGYRALVEKLRGVVLDKGETRSDWLRRPLSESQCHYAALDVLELLPAWRQLRQRAEAQERMTWLLEDGREARAALGEREAGLYRRIKGSGRLNARQMEILRRVVDWREERARRLDKPRGWILDDKACLALAREMPRRLEALESIEPLPPVVLKRQGKALLGLVHDAMDAPSEALPEPAPAPLNPEQRQRLKDLREDLRTLAEGLHIAPEAALTGAELERLVRETSEADVDAPARWFGWREQTLLKPLRSKLRKDPQP